MEGEEETADRRPSRCRRVSTYHAPEPLTDLASFYLPGKIDAVMILVLQMRSHNSMNNLPRAFYSKKGYHQYLNSNLPDFGVQSQPPRL